MSAVGLNNVIVKTSYGNLVFDDVIEISWLAKDQPFSRPGDSGSIVFTKKGRNAVGLHFAGGVKQAEDGTELGVSYSCNLATALAVHGVALVS